MQKTIGGERLGAGKKMKVELHNFERSTHNLSSLFRTTMSAGTLVPFLTKVGLPGDTFDIELNCDVKTHPTVGPLFGSFKVQLDVFMIPIRLYIAALHNNELGLGLKMQNVKLPILKTEVPQLPSTTTDYNNWQINPSCILSYLGLRGFGLRHEDATDKTRSFNGIPFLAFWDIYKNYYANKQEEIGYVIHTPVSVPDENITSMIIPAGTIPQTTGTTPLNWLTGQIITITYTGTEPDANNIMVYFGVNSRASISEIATRTNSGTGMVQYTLIRPPLTILWWDYATPGTPVASPIKLIEFNLDEIDVARKKILAAPASSPFDIWDELGDPYSTLLENEGGLRSMSYSQEGLPVKTYQSDLLNNWIQTEWIDGTEGINSITAIDTSGGEFTIDTLILARKVYNMLNRIAISGGTYDDWLDAVYTTERMQRVETPVYMGGLSKELIFQEVVSNSLANTSDNSQPLGTLAGKGVMSGKHKGGKVIIKCDEPCYIMGIVSLTPRIDYSQGNNWDMWLQSIDDLHKPPMDEIGFQELITEQMAWWDTQQQSDGTWLQKSAGKQPAWINYMTEINKTYGNFAIQDNEMFMTLNRKYQEGDGGIQDVTTYIDPAKYNSIFAQTSLDSQNFWVQIACNITARRKMSAKIMPNL